MKLEQLFENENNLITPTKFKNYFLEICPEEYEFKSQWGPKGVLYNCNSTIDGYKNTVQMYLHGNKLAKKVLNLKIDGKDDWYIPAKDELDHIYNSGVIKNDKWYWTSTEFSTIYSWEQYFHDGHQSGNSKVSATYMRAVRRVYENQL